MPVEKERHTEHHLSQWVRSSQQEGYNWSIVTLQDQLKTSEVQSTLSP